MSCAYAEVFILFAAYNNVYQELLHMAKIGKSAKQLSAVCGPAGAVFNADRITLLLKVKPPLNYLWLFSRLLRFIIFANR